MRLTKHICPQCGAQMELKSGASRAVCEYCGSMMQIEGAYGEIYDETM